MGLARIFGVDGLAGKLKKKLKIKKPFRKLQGMNV
jgi:hypothetical protein